MTCTISPRALSSSTRRGNFPGPSRLGLCSAARLRARCPLAPSSCSCQPSPVRSSSPRSLRSRRVRTAGSWVKLPLYGLLGRRFDVAFARLDLRPAQLTFLRHSQVRLIYRLDLIMVLPIAFRKLLNDLIDLGSRKSNAQSGQELNFLADSEFVHRHPSTRCANARRLLPLNHRAAGHPAESIARRRTGPGAVSRTPVRSDFLLGIPRRLASVANTDTLFGAVRSSSPGVATANGATPASATRLSRGLLDQSTAVSKW